MFARKRCERLRRQTSRRSLARWSRVEGRGPVHLPRSWAPIRETGGQQCARTLGITMALPLLARADEGIEGASVVCAPGQRGRHAALARTIAVRVWTISWR